MGLSSFILVLSMFCGSVLAMNKAELIDAMAKDAGLSRADAGNVLNAFVGATSDALKKGDRIALVGFGTFSVTRHMSSSSACHVTREVTFIPASTFNASDSTQETNVEVRGWNPTSKKKKSAKSSKKTVDVVARSTPPVNTIFENGENAGRIIQDKEMLMFMNVLSGKSSENLVPAYDALLGTIIRVVNSGEEVDIEEFGIFHNSDVIVVTAPARKGRNPQTGSTIQIKAKKVAKFKAGAALANTVK